MASGERELQPKARKEFGITVGNDVSERAWQAADLQWLRAKGHHGFDPIGPMVVRGVDYRDLLLETRVNGDVVEVELEGVGVIRNRVVAVGQGGDLSGQP
jgi:2-keto-4-pentenoate hydratase/2-oxohepta-3-ene-1,7-dioic acid hydratase in catechol pathway